MPFRKSWRYNLKNKVFVTPPWLRGILLHWKVQVLSKFKPNIYSATFSPFILVSALSFSLNGNTFLPLYQNLSRSFPIPHNLLCDTQVTFRKCLPFPKWSRSFPPPPITLVWTVLFERWCNFEHWWWRIPASTIRWDVIRVFCSNIRTFLLILEILTSNLRFFFSQLVTSYYVQDFHNQNRIGCSTFRTQQKENTGLS